MLIDEVLIFNRYISGPELAYLYRRGALFMPDKTQAEKPEASKGPSNNKRLANLNKTVKELREEVQNLRELLDALEALGEASEKK